MDTRNLNKSLIKYIYDTIDISRFKYEILKNTTQLPLLISTTYFISPLKMAVRFLFLPTTIFISHCNESCSNK